MSRNLFTILDDLTGNLAELKAALAPLALIGGPPSLRRLDPSVVTYSVFKSFFMARPPDARAAPRPSGCAMPWMI